MQPRDPMSELRKFAAKPHNRKERRRVAKKLKANWETFNPMLNRRVPIMLGIKRFKKAAGDDSEIKGVYKENAWKSREQLIQRRLRGEGEAQDVSTGDGSGKKKAARRLPGKAKPQPGRSPEVRR